jgi:hypothetical protein
MTDARQDRKPEQLSLFQRKTGETVRRALEAGDLDGYRISVLGWWRVYEDKLFEYEDRMRLKFRDQKSG